VDLISTIEQATVARLQDQAGDRLKVGAYPAQPKSFRLLGQTSGALVVYQGSQYTGEQDGLDVRRQRWLVTLLARGLHEHSGAYPLIELIQQALTGWVPQSGLRPFWPERDEFVDENDGIWRYDLAFLLESPLSCGACEECQ
jgi:hypothetical protein